MKKDEEPNTARSLFELSHHEVFSSVGKNERQEYAVFCQKRVSKITIAILLLWFTICSVYILTVAIVYAKNRYFFIAIAVCYFVLRNPLLILYVYKSTGKNGQVFRSTLANTSTVQSSICMGLFLVGRVYNGHCSSNDLVQIWSCNPEESSHALPQDVMFCLLIIPIMASIIFKTVKWQSVLASWLITVGFMSYAIWVGDAVNSIPVLVFYIPISVILMYENYRQDIILFLMSRKKDDLLDENRRLSEEAQNELRFMIANMAHDLKTVSIIDSLQCIEPYLSDFSRCHLS